MNDDETGFAARWSKRKLAAKQQGETENQPENGFAQQDKPAQKAGTANQNDQQDHLAESDFDGESFDDVDFDALDETSDYTRFARVNVPAEVQQKALRKLWESDSVFETLDGLNDYDEDFTGDGLAGKALKTAYKVGRGFLSDDEEETASITRPDSDRQADASKETPAATEEGNRDSADDEQSNSDESMS